MMSISKLFWGIMFLLFTLQSCTVKWETVNPVIPRATGNIVTYLEQPASNSVVTGSIQVKVLVFDDKDDVSKVELILDQQLLKTWYNPPYELFWTPPFDDSSSHLTYARAFDGENNMAESHKVKFIYRTYLEPQIPELNFDPLNKNSVLLTWTDKWGDETSFVVEEKIWKSVLDTTTFTSIAVLPGDITEYTKTGLDSNFRYSYRVKATKNDISYPYSNEIKIYYTLSDQFNIVQSFESNAIEIIYLRNEDLIAGWGISESINLWNINGVLVRKLVHSERIDACAVSADEKLIAGSAGGSLKIWNVSDGSLIRTLSAGGNQNLLSLSADNKYLASASELKVNIWDITTGNLVSQFSNSRQISSMTISSDNITLITGDHIDIKFWDFINGVLTKTINVNPAINIISLEMNNNGSEFATAGYHIKLWNYPEGTLKSSLSSDRETFLKYNADGTRLLSCTRGLLEIWDLNTFVKAESWFVKNALTSAAFGAGGTVITAGDMIKVWEKTSGWTSE